MKVNAIIMTPFSLLNFKNYIATVSILQEYLVWMPLWPRNFVCGKVMVYSYGSPLVSSQRGAQAPVFDISRQSSTRRPTTAHLLKIWPCCRSFTGTRRRLSQSQIQPDSRSRDFWLRKRKSTWRRNCVPCSCSSHNYTVKFLFILYHFLLCSN